MTVQSKPRKASRVVSRWCGQTLLLFPVYLLAMLTGTPFLVFTVVCLTTMCMVMTVIINDRNKEIYDLSQILEAKAEDAKQRRIRPARDAYWKDINEVSRRRAKDDLARKRRAAENYMDSSDQETRERGYAMLSQVAAAEKAGLVAIPELRIGDDERDQVMGQLGDHYAAGRLTRDELDDRMNTAIHSKTAVELAVLLRDLP